MWHAFWMMCGDVYSEENGSADGVEIVLSAGDYILPQGMEFTAQDGAAPGAAPVVWRAEKPGEARIMGSMRVPAASFAKVSDPALLARLPEEGRGKVYAAKLIGHP